MDRDEFVRLLEEPCCYHLKNFVLDREWASLCGLSRVSINEREEDRFILDFDKSEEKKMKKKDKTASKVLELSVEDSQFYEKIRKEQEEARIKSSNKFSQSVHSNIDDYYFRKNAFFMKIASSTASNRYKCPQLSFMSNSLLESHVVGNLVEGTFPGLKPSVSWPVSLDDLLMKLSSVTIEELFHQPFEHEQEFQREAEIFIHKELESVKKYEMEKEEMNVNLFREYAAKAIQAYITMMILLGNQSRLLGCMQFLRKMHGVYGNTFEIVFSISALALKPLLASLMSYYTDANVYPVLQNYCINDVFNVSKNVLFAPNRYPFGQCTSITTDGKYLFIIQAGVNGGMYKVGTGYGNTDIGKVYFYRKMPDVDDTFQWVYLKEKLYVKLGSRDFGYISVMSPETFEKISQVKLLFSEHTQHSAIKKKSENFILLSDGEKLLVVTVEPVMNQNPQEPIGESSSPPNRIKRPDEDNNDEGEEELKPPTSTSPDKAKLSDVYTYINLVLYSYDVEMNSGSHCDNEKESLVKELEESFSYFYSRDECYKAMAIANWNFEQAAVQLIDNGERVKEPVLVSDNSVILLQCKLEGLCNQSGTTEFKVEANSILDVSVFDTLRWTCTKDYVIAYKFKDGLCYIFSKDKKNLRDIPIAQSNEDKAGGSTEPQRSSSVKGTFIKSIPSAKLTRVEYPITYDLTNQIYYLISNSSLISQSIHIADSLYDYYTGIHNTLLKQFNISDSSEFVSHLLNSCEIFTKFYDNFLNFLLLINCKKPALYWKYHNWNYFYTSYFQKLYDTFRETDLKDKKTLALLKTLGTRIVKSRIMNEREMIEKLNKELHCDNVQERFNLDLEGKMWAKTHPVNSRDKPPGLSDITAFDVINWCNWNYNQNMLFDCKRKLEPPVQEGRFLLGLENKKDYYLCMNGGSQSLKECIELISECQKSKDIEALKRGLMFLYFFFENVDSTILMPLVNKNKPHNELIDVLLPQLKTILMDLFSIDELKSLITAVIIAGWEVICYDMASQLEWFYSIYNSSLKMTAIVPSCSPISVEKSIVPLMNNLINPISALVNRIKLLTRPSYNPFIFNRINIVKYYIFDSVNNLIYGSSPYPGGFNISLFQFPFHWILCGKILQLGVQAKLDLLEKKEDGVKKKPEMKGMTIGKILEKHTDFIRTEERIFEEDERMEKIIQTEDATIAINTFSYSNAEIRNFRVSKADQTCYVNQEEKIKSLSESFWIFACENILNGRIDFANDLLSLLTDLTFHAFADMHDTAMNNLGENNSKYDLYVKYFSETVLSLLLNQMKLSLSLFKSRSSEITSEMSKNILIHLHYILNLLTSKITIYNVKTLSTIHSALMELLNEILLRAKINDSIKAFTSQGYQIENEKDFEFSFTPTDVTKIYEVVKYSGSSAIISELEMKPGPERPNIDIILISEEHSYGNFRNNTNNNYGSLGTCFMMKLNNMPSVSKKLFLPGEEMKLMTNPDYDYRSRRDPRFGSSPGGKGLPKSILKVKCYPFRERVFLLTQKESTDNQIQQDLCFLLEFACDIDYYNTLIVKKLSRSTEVENLERFITEPSLFTLTKMGLNTYTCDDTQINDTLLEIDAKVKTELMHKEIEEASKSLIPLDKNPMSNADDPRIDPSKELVSKLLSISSDLSRYSQSIQNYIKDILAMLQDIETNRSLQIPGDNIFNKLKAVCREVTFEPTNYRTLKMFPSFNAQMKSLWNVCELAFILSLMYHTNSLPSSIKFIEESQKSTESGEVQATPGYFEYFGKKLNSLLLWMTSRVQYMKDTFDSIKSYSEMIVKANNEFLENIRQLLIDKIRHIEEEKRNASHVSDSSKTTTETTETKAHSKAKSKTPNLSTFAKGDKFEKLDLAAKNTNFKKKAHVKRLYQELPKKKSKKKASEADSNNSGQGTPSSLPLKGEDLPKEDDESTCSIPIESLGQMSIEEILGKFPQMRAEFLNKENIKKVKEEIKAKIENDIKDSYFGNAEKLKNVCEIYDISFSEANLADALKNYTSCVLGKLWKVYNFNSYETCERMDMDKIYEKIYQDSPYKILVYYVLDKIFFLLELKNDEMVKIDGEIPGFHTQTTGTVGASRKKAPLEGEDQDGAALGITLSSQGIVKAIFSLIYKSPETDIIRGIMNSQMKRLRIREIGINCLAKHVNDNLYGRMLYNISTNSAGLFAAAVKNGISNGIDCSIRAINIPIQHIENVVYYYFRMYINEMDILTRIKKTELGKFKYVSCGRNNISKESCPYDIFLAHRIKNINLILSDINIYLSHILTLDEKNFEKSAKPLPGIKKSSIKGLIHMTLQIIINEEIKSNLKMAKILTDLSANFRSLLSKLVQFNRYFTNQRLTDKIIDGLFVSLDNVMTDCDNQVMLISNLLNIIYHIVLSLSSTSTSAQNSSFAIGVQKLFSLILISNTPEIISLSCKIAKLFLKTSSSGDINVPKEIMQALYAKLGKIWTHRKEENDKDTYEEKKRYNILIQMNSPEFDYHFLVNMLYYWEESYPTKLSEYKTGLKITQEEMKRNEIVVYTPPGREMTHFIPLKNKVSKTYNLENAVIKRQEDIKREIGMLTDTFKQQKEKEEAKKREEQLKREEELKKEEQSKEEALKKEESSKQEALKKEESSKQEELPKPQEEPPKPQEEQPKPQEEQPKPQEELPKPQEELPKPQEELPKPQEELPKPQEELPKPQEELPKPQEELPKPQEEPPKPQEEPPKPQEEPPKPQEEQPKQDELSHSEEPSLKPATSEELFVDDAFGLYGNRDADDPSKKKPKTESKKEWIPEVPKVPQDLTEEEYHRKIQLLKTREAYLNRILSHIKTCAKIGEAASNRGFAMLDTKFSKKEAEEFSKLVYKAFYRLVNHIPSEKTISVEGTVQSESQMEYLFSNDDIFPKLYDIEIMLPGCTNILKETTKSCLNVTLIEASIYTKLEKTLKNFANANPTSSRNDYGSSSNNEKRLISSNVNEQSEKIINDKFISGHSMSCIIEDILGLIYYTETDEHEFGEKILASINRIELSEWSKITSQEKMSILGQLITISGYFKIIREGSKAIFNNNVDDMCKIISGGHKTGKTSVNAIFVKDKQCKVEKLNLSGLKKVSANDSLLRPLDIVSLAKGVIKAWEIFQNESTSPNFDYSYIKSIFLFLLKILVLKSKGYSDEIFIKIPREQMAMLFEIISIITHTSNWTEKDEEFWEVELVDAWERMYSSQDCNSNLMYSPLFEEPFGLILPETYPKSKEAEITTSVDVDIITKHTLPESAYVVQLPPIVDMSKSKLALKNIQQYERYTVEEVFNYAKSNYRDHEYLFYLRQVRQELSSNEITNARNDIYVIFDQTRVPPGMPLPREHRDNREIFKEECYTGNYYLARLSNKLIRETGINSLMKQMSMGVNEIPVLVLLVDLSIQMALVLYNDCEYCKIHSFWISVDHLMLLDYQLKLPSSSISQGKLTREYKEIYTTTAKVYSKKLMSYLMESLLLQSKLAKFEDVLKFLQLSSWQNNINNPITGVLTKCKNCIQVKKKEEGDELDFRRMLSSKAEKGMSPSNSNMMIPKCDLTSILANINSKQVNPSTGVLESRSKFIDSASNYHMIEKYLYDFEDIYDFDLLKNWCIENLEKINSEVLRVKIKNLSESYMKELKNITNSKAFSLGSVGNKLLAIHEMFEIDTEQYCGMVMSFEDTALLGPNAKLSFYSDPYGENLLSEVIAIKSTRTNLESVVFNQSKVWMYYTPGTTAFYINDWNTRSRDSDLPCSLTYVPYTWPSLLWLTDFCTSNLFKHVTKDSLSVLQSFIKKLLSLCTTLSLPAEVQRNVLNLTNRVILKAIKYVSMLEHSGQFSMRPMSISDKFNLIGFDEVSVIQIIKNIDKCFESSHAKDKCFSSSYIVDGVEILLGILAGIKESYQSLEQYLKENFDYCLPLWIEAIIKLGQFLNFLQGTSSLESNLMNELKDQISVKNMKLFNNIFIVENIPTQVEDNVIIDEIHKTLKMLNAKIVNKDADIQIFHAEETKSVVFITDGYNFENLKEMVDVQDVEEEQPPQDQLWICPCGFDNAMENLTCCACDKERPPIVKEEKKKKHSLIRVEAYNYTIEDIVECLKNNIAKNDKLTNYTIKEEVVTVKVEEKKPQGGDQESQMKEIASTQILSQDNEASSGGMIKEPPEPVKTEESQLKIISGEKVCRVGGIPDVPKVLPPGLRMFSQVDKPLAEENVPVVKTEDVKVTETQKIEPQYRDVVKTNHLSILTIEHNGHFNHHPLLNKFLRARLAIYAMDKDYFAQVLCSLKNHPKLTPKEIECLGYYQEKIVFTTNEEKNKFIEFMKSDINTNNLQEKGEIHDQSQFNFHMFDYVSFYQMLEHADVDLWLENCYMEDLAILNDIKITQLEKIRELVDYTLCKETPISYVFPASAIRFVPPQFSSLNHSTMDVITNYYTDLSECPLKLIRYYWSIIRYFNGCLLAALPFIKPPDAYAASSSSDLEDKEYINIPFPKSISMFLSSAKGIAFSSTKSGLTREVLSYTEFSPEEVQIPTFKFERLQIIHKQDSKTGNKEDFAKPSFIRTARQEDAGIDEAIVGNAQELISDESMFLQAYEQGKDLDPAFFRSKTVPGDPHMGFKVEFKGEQVQGLGGPYRQFFSDIAEELQPKDASKKSLKILCPSSNNVAKRGDYKDKYVLTPGYNNNTALNHYEFLGILMGICIRTGVHIPLDLCSIVWKKLTDEIMTKDDVKEFDEGLIEQINFMQNEIDMEAFESLNQTYSVELTDRAIFDLIPNGSCEKVAYEDRGKFMELAIKARLMESDKQITAIKRGLYKIIPCALIKLMTYKELERLVSGSKTVDVDMLKAHSKYSMDLNDQSNRIKWFWEMLNEMSNEDRVKFIKFCWAQERLPSTHEEYEKLHVTFTIKPYTDRNKIDIFPKADTCFFSLELPDYSSKEVMKSKILSAIYLDNVSINADKELPSGGHESNERYRQEYDEDEE